MSLPSLKTIFTTLVASTGAATGTVLCLVAVFEPDLSSATVSPFYSSGMCCAAGSAGGGRDAV